MRIRVLLGACVAVMGTVAGVHGQSPLQVKEVRISPMGQLRGVLLGLHTFELAVDDSGRLLDVSVSLFGDGPFDYRFSPGKVDKLQKGLVSCEFDSERLRRIGAYDVRFASDNSGRIESIGDSSFAYRSGSGKNGQLARIGNLEIKYSLTDKRIESIGALKLEYRRQDGHLERFTRDPAKARDALVGVRICYPEEEAGTN
jgi:hypothetical protein